jgi:hypothetical protein
MKFDYIMDPGHGWLKVPKALLAQLGIADKISPYSYQRGEYAYLEEDCDLTAFHAAATAAGIEVVFRNRHSDRESRVRHYEGYKA